MSVGTFLCTSGQQKHSKRLIRDMCTRHGWDTTQEMKWFAMDAAQRLDFATRAQKLTAKYAGIELHSITVNKRRVASHIRDDANKLYNWMIRLALLQPMRKFDHVTFIPDERAIKIKSGNSLEDYLQIEMWFASKATTALTVMPHDSSRTINLQFADMLAGTVQSHFERGYSDPWRSLKKRIEHTKLFF